MVWEWFYHTMCIFYLFLYIFRLTRFHYFLCTLYYPTYYENINIVQLKAFTQTHPSRIVNSWQRHYRSKLFSRYETLLFTRISNFRNIRNSTGKFEIFVNFATLFVTLLLRKNWFYVFQTSAFIWRPVREAQQFECLHFSSLHYSWLDDTTAMLGWLPLISSKKVSLLHDRRPLGYEEATQGFQEKIPSGELISLLMWRCLHDANCAVKNGE